MTLPRSMAWIALSAIMALAVAGCEAASGGSPTAPYPDFDLVSASSGPFVTTGGAEITIIVDDFTERWSFTASIAQDGAQQGQFQWSGMIFGDHVNAHGYVRCFGITGNRARLGGVVTHSNPPGLAGSQVIWTVEDQGSNAPAPDGASALQIGEPEPHCLVAPVPDPTLFPVESGNVHVHQ